MFVSVARVTLQIPESGSLKAKRQVVRRVSDRVKARFNVAVAEVEDNEVWSRAVIALAVVSNERRHAVEQIDKICQFIDDLYVAPITHRETETLSFGDQLFADAADDDLAQLTIPRGDRPLAEAEGMPAWENRFDARPSAPAPRPSMKPRPSAKQPVSLENARAAARRLRNPRDWEKDEP